MIGRTDLEEHVEEHGLDRPVDCPVDRPISSITVKNGESQSYLGTLTVDHDIAVYLQLTTQTPSSSPALFSSLGPQFSLTDPQRYRLGRHVVVEHVSSTGLPQ